MEASTLNCIKNNASKKEFSENEINTKKKTISQFKQEEEPWNAILNPF